MATQTVTHEAVALKLTGMSQEEYSQVMKKNERWPHDSTDDGWYMAHQALRLDMQEAADAFHAVVDRLEKGTNVEDWMIANIKTWWAPWIKILVHHHDNEEKIAFPWMNKTVQLPDKMSADHPKLMAVVDTLSAMIADLKPGAALDDNKAVYTKLRDTFDAFRTDMCEHLKEEDDVGLPTLRKHFTYKEFQPVEKQIIATLTPLDVGWFLRPLAEPDRKRWMTDVGRMPGFVQSLIMLPACKKYYNKIALPMLEVKAGERLKPIPSGCFGLF